MKKFAQSMRASGDPFSTEPDMIAASGCIRWLSRSPAHQSGERRQWSSVTATIWPRARCIPAERRTKMDAPGSWMAMAPGKRVAKSAGRPFPSPSAMMSSPCSCWICDHSESSVIFNSGHG